MSEAGRIGRVGNAAEARELQMLDRRHSVAARARDVALFRCDEEVEARRQAENLAEAVEKESRLRVQAEMCLVPAALGDKEERRRKQEERRREEEGPSRAEEARAVNLERKMGDCLSQMG